MPRPLCTTATGFAAFAELGSQGSLAKISDFGQLTENARAVLQKGFQVLFGVNANLRELTYTHGRKASGMICEQVLSSNHR